LFERFLFSSLQKFLIL